MAGALTPAPCPGRFNLARYVLRAAKRTPDKIALEVLGAPGAVDLSLSYAALDRQIRGVATGLAAAGLGRGDILVLRLGNNAAFPIAFLAAVTLGAIPVPVSAALTDGELTRLLPSVRPVRAAVCAPERPVPADGFTIDPATLLAWADNPPAAFADTCADEPAYIVFTSGSSGRARAVVHAHRAVWARRMMWQDWYDLRADDRMLHAGAFNWTYTLGTGLMDPWTAGATALVMTGPPTREVWAPLARAHRPSLFAAVPGVFRQILGSRDGPGDAFSSLRHALSAGEALDPQVRHNWKKATGTDIHTALGMSEISTYVSSAPHRPLRDGAAGRPQRGRRVTVRGPSGPVVPGTAGELAVHQSDAGLMLGYRDSDGTVTLPLDEGWFLTGDRARVGADGQIEHLGRADDLMTAGGFRVAPQEVEAALAYYPGIRDIAVTQIPVKDGVHVIAAFFTGAVDEAGLRAYVEPRLAGYKRPRHYQRVAELPTNANGKIIRRRLRDLWTRP